MHGSLSVNVLLLNIGLVVEQLLGVWCAIVVGSPHERCHTGAIRNVYNIADLYPKALKSEVKDVIGILNNKDALARMKSNDEICWRFEI